MKAPNKPNFGVRYYIIRGISKKNTTVTRKFFSLTEAQKVAKRAESRGYPTELWQKKGRKWEEVL